MRRRAMAMQQRAARQGELINFNPGQYPRDLRMVAGSTARGACCPGPDPAPRPQQLDELDAYVAPHPNDAVRLADLPG